MDLLWDGHGMATFAIHKLSAKSSDIYSSIMTVKLAQSYNGQGSVIPIQSIALSFILY